MLKKRRNGELITQVFDAFYENPQRTYDDVAIKLGVQSITVAVTVLHWKGHLFPEMIKYGWTKENMIALVRQNKEALRNGIRFQHQFDFWLDKLEKEGLI